MSCPESVCGKPKTFNDLSWSNTDRYTKVGNCPINDVGVNKKWCNTDPTVNVCGHVNTSNVGYIPMHGACSYPNRNGFYKKQQENSKWSEFQGRRPGHLRISQTYLGDISPMFGAKTAYENVYGPIIKPVPVDASTIYVYPDGQAYPQHMYI
jgi:hypothetical protein